MLCEGHEAGEQQAAYTHATHVSPQQYTQGDGGGTNGQLQQLDRTHGSDEPPFAAREMQERQLKRLREEHQKEVFSDTDRLVQLATALKSEVEKRDKTVPPDAVKDVDEIGKLAKRVSERIKMQ